MSMSKNKLPELSDVMLKKHQFPIVNEKTILKQAIEEMNKWRLGIICVCNAKGQLMGIITDGDLRRKILNIQKPLPSLFLDDVIIHCIQSPQVISEKSSLIDVVDIMGSKGIWDLPVTDDENVLIGLLHLHPIVDALIKDKTLNRN
jgi:CBS domain-containing protein